MLQWRDAFKDRAQGIFANHEQQKRVGTQVAELERMVGKLAMENDILKKLRMSKLLTTDDENRIG